MNEAVYITTMGRIAYYRSLLRKTFETFKNSEPKVREVAEISHSNGQT